jgi:hypothetical protein
MNETAQFAAPQVAHRANVKLRNEPKLAQSLQTFNPLQSNDFIYERQPLSPTLLPEQFALLSRILE